MLLVAKARSRLFNFSSSECFPPCFLLLVVGLLPNAQRLNDLFAPSAPLIVDFRLRGVEALNVGSRLSAEYLGGGEERVVGSRGGQAHLISILGREEILV